MSSTSHQDPEKFITP